jgi:hypothetical protein
LIIQQKSIFQAGEFRVGAHQPEKAGGIGRCTVVLAETQGVFIQHPSAAVRKILHHTAAFRRENQRFLPGAPQHAGALETIEAVGGESVRVQDFDGKSRRFLQQSEQVAGAAGDDGNGNRHKFPLSGPGTV